MELPSFVILICYYASIFASIYSLLCTVRIFFTWVQSLEYSKVGRFLSKVCDPYLNFFKIKALRINNFDLSPIIALVVLWGITQILNTFASQSTISLGIILSILVLIIWRVISSVLGFFAIILVVRLIVLLINARTYGTIWDNLDRAISPIIFKMTNMFYKNQSVSFKKSLIIAIIECGVLYFGLSYVIERILVPTLTHLPI